MNDVDVLIRVAADAADGARGMDDVADAAVRMSNDVERASKDAARSLDGVGDAVDGTASNASTLAGAFGDVAGGLGLIGLGGFSDELESLAPALMLAAGAADIASVAMKAGSLAKLKDVAATAAQRASSIASTVATGAQTAAQWALNAAMSANPIMVVVLAVVALVAILVLAYKKSSTFREAIQAAGRAGRAAVGWIIDKIRDLVGWVREKAPAAFRALKGAGTTALRALTLPTRTVINVVKNLITWVKDKASAAFRVLRGVVGPVFDAIKRPIETVKDLIKDVVDFIKNIDLGPIDDIIGGIGKVLRPSAQTRGRAPARTDSSGVTNIVNLTIVQNGVLDADRAAQRIEKVVGGRRRLIGKTVTP